MNFYEKSSQSLERKLRRKSIAFSLFSGVIFYFHIKGLSYQLSSSSNIFFTTQISRIPLFIVVAFNTSLNAPIANLLFSMIDYIEPCCLHRISSKQNYCGLRLCSSIFYTSLPAFKISPMETSQVLTYFVEFF